MNYAEKSLRRRLKEMRADCADAGIIPEQARFRNVPLADFSKEDLMVLAAYYVFNPADRPLSALG